MTKPICDLDNDRREYLVRLRDALNSRPLGSEASFILRQKRINELNEMVGSNNQSFTFNSQSSFEMWLKSREDEINKW